MKCENCKKEVIGFFIEDNKNICLKCEIEIIKKEKQFGIGLK